MAKTTMYLIQRKSDGMFFLNKGFHSFHEHSHADNMKGEFGAGHPSNWTKNKSECRPFKTIGGAKSSRGWVHTLYFNAADCYKCKVMGIDDRGYYDMPLADRRNHNHFRKMTEAEQPYRIIEVKVSID